MTRLVRSPLIALATLAIIASPSAAQGRAEREGFWIGAGLAAASGECTQIAKALGQPRCSVARKLGFSGTVQMGGTISRRTLLGVEATGWAHQEPDTTREYGVVTLAVYLFPSVQGPYYLKAGIGVGRYAEDATDPETMRSTVMTANGFALSLGVGVDFAVSRRITLSPFTQYLVATDQSAVRARQALSDPLDFNLFQVGLVARWQ